MKGTLLIIFLLAFSISGNAQSKIKLEIDAKLPAKYATKSKGYLATAAAQFFPFVEITIKKVKYKIAFDKENSNIKYIFTNDKEFVDANDRKVGQEVTVKYEDIEILGYFQLRTKPDKNGWQAVIGDISSFEGDFLERMQQAGHLTTEIDGFVKGYNY